MSVSYLSHVFISAESGLDWNRAPDLIGAALPEANVTPEPAMTLSSTDPVPIRAAWSDGYELWLYAAADVRQFIDETLASVELPTPIAHQMRDARTSAIMRVEITGDHDLAGGGEHFNDWARATETLAALPGAFDIDATVIDEAPPRAEPQ